MTIGKQFRSIERKFVITVVALATLSVLALGFILYEANSVRFNGQVSSTELSMLVSENPAVVEYLEQEKDYQAHFITIANLVKQEQQESLTNALILVTVPVLIIAGLLGYIVAKYLLRPVKEAYESQERFMQDAAHELRNPLAAISVALQNAPPDRQDANLVVTLKRQTKRLVNIVEDMLFLERRKSGDSVTSTNLSNLLQDVLEDLQPSINSKKLKLKTKINEDITMTIDPQDFIKLSRNLIENAIKYSKNNQTVNVGLVRNGRISLTVKDRGIGIPAEELSNIGERFYRAKNVSKTPGTGLGIAIVMKVLNAYGGKLKIESTFNKGTEVTVTL